MPGESNIGLLSGMGLKPNTMHKMEVVGVLVAIFTAAKDGGIPTGVKFIIPKGKEAANLLLRVSEGIIRLQ